MPAYRIIMHPYNVEIAENHYIHAENTRDAKFKSLKFQCGKSYRKIEYLRKTEMEVREECGIFED